MRYNFWPLSMDANKKINQNSAKMYWYLREIHFFLCCLISYSIPILYAFCSKRYCRAEQKTLCTESSYSFCYVQCPLYLQGGKEGLFVSILVYPYSSRMGVLLQEQSRAVLCQHRMFDIQRIQYPLLQWLILLTLTVSLYSTLAGAFTQLTSDLWLHSSYITPVISSRSWRLDFPSDLC